MIPCGCNNHPGNEAQIGLGRGEASILANYVDRKLFQNKILRHNAIDFDHFSTAYLFDNIVPKQSDFCDTYAQ